MGRGHHDGCDDRRDVRIDHARVAYCWGLLRFNSFAGSRRPVAVPGGYRFTSISVGTFHSCALTAEGRAVCWGRYQFVSTDQQPPAPIVDTLRFSTLAVGNGYACGLVQQRLHCRERSALRFEPRVDSVRFQSVSSANGVVCALDLGGASWCWDYGERWPDTAQVVRGPVAFRALSGEWANRCAIGVDDAAYCWGPPGFEGDPPGGRVHSPVPGGLRFRTLSVGVDYACGLTLDDLAYCWGRNDRGQFGNGAKSVVYTNTPTAVTGDIRFASIATGYTTTCAVARDGRAYCWGNAYEGQVGDASPAPSVGTTDERLVPTRVANPLR